MSALEYGIVLASASGEAVENDCGDCAAVLD